MTTILPFHCSNRLLIGWKSWRRVSHMEEVRLKALPKIVVWILCCIYICFVFYNGKFLRNSLLLHLLYGSVDQQIKTSELLLMAFQWRRRRGVVLFLVGKDDAVLWHVDGFVVLVLLVIILGWSFSRNWQSCCCLVFVIPPGDIVRWFRYKTRVAPVKTFGAVSYTHLTLPTKA